MYATVKQPAEAAIRPTLTGTPKQLEITVTHRKQNVELISNRDTNTTPSNALNRPILSGLSQRRLSRAPISNQQSHSPSLPFRARHTPFLIVSPKRLEIAVSHRKQNTEVISNRMKIDPLPNAIERLCGRLAQEYDERQNRGQDSRATNGNAASSDSGQEKVGVRRGRRGKGQKGLTSEEVSYIRALRGRVRLD
jgi:hypothetical protein